MIGYRRAEGVESMVEASANPTIVYTDGHVEKLNLRLVRASEYLQRF